MAFYNTTSDGDLSNRFGLPIRGDLKLRGYHSTDEYYHLTDVLCAVTQTKNIVTTAVQGRNGTVKEFVSDGDYQISVVGRIVSAEADMFPFDEVTRFLALLKRQEPLEVVSPFVQLFGVYELVVTSYTLAQEEGMENVQTFSFDAVSETPVDLIEES
jgi:hypothetical protein